MAMACLRFDRDVMPLPQANISLKTPKKIYSCDNMCISRIALQVETRYRHDTRTPIEYDLLTRVTNTPIQPRWNAEPDTQNNSNNSNSTFIAALWYDVGAFTGFDTISTPLLHNDKGKHNHVGVKSGWVKLKIWLPFSAEETIPNEIATKARDLRASV